MPAPYRGRCLCGAVRFEIDEFLPGVSHCHCSMCRKFHGADYATYGSIQKSNFRWIKGEEMLKDYVAENGTTRQFCQHCGSSMTFTSAKGSGKEVEIALGTLDDDLPLKADAHIFVDYAANWSAITDDLPQFRETRGSGVVGTGD